MDDAWNVKAGTSVSGLLTLLIHVRQSSCVTITLDICVSPIPLLCVEQKAAVARAAFVLKSIRVQKAKKV